MPTPTPTSTPAPENASRPALDSRILLIGNYRFLYDERAPQGIYAAAAGQPGLPANPTLETDSSGGGISAQVQSLFWLGEPNTLLGNIGIGVDISTLGGMTANTTPTQTELSELFWGNLSGLYKVVSTPNFDLAAGLDGYFRYTGSSDDPRTDYFKAARTYIGVGARVDAAYRIIDPLSLELRVAPHFVIQDLANIDIPQLPLNRFDTQIQLMLNWDFMKFGTSRLSANLGYQGLLLFELGGEGSQMIHGGIFGVGYHF